MTVLQMWKTIYSWGYTKPTVIKRKVDEGVLTKDNYQEIVGQPYPEDAKATTTSQAPSSASEAPKTSSASSSQASQASSASSSASTSQASQATESK